MIDIKQQEELFIAIGNILDKKTSTYAIGGTAMMLRGIKDSTLDVDLVFENNKDRENFILALKKLGAKESDVTLVYGLKGHTPVMLKLENVHFDLFTNRIITARFSEKMKNRAQQIHEFGKSLIIRLADPHDLIIMKSATSRIKDLEDITTLINKNPINWNMLIEEAKEQVNLGNEGAILSLGEKLEKLNNQNLITLPKTVLDSLWKLLKNQINKKSKK